MDEAIRIHFPDGRGFTRLRAGCSARVALPETVDGDELFAAARERGVLVGADPSFTSSGGGRNTLRLTFASSAEEQIRPASPCWGSCCASDGRKTARCLAKRNFEAVPIL